MTPTDTPAVCDVCGSTALVQIKCKVICRNCGTIIRSCADLSALLGWRATTLLAVICAFSLSCASHQTAPSSRGVSEQVVPKRPTRPQALSSAGFRNSATHR